MAAGGFGHLGLDERQSLIRLKEMRTMRRVVLLRCFQRYVKISRRQVGQTAPHPRKAR